MAARALVLTAALLLAGLPAPAPADTPPPQGPAQGRANSCASTAFEAIGKAAPTAYVHKKFGVRGETEVGGALLEWCQSAQNAVIYFYVADQAATEHNRCPQNMSIAVFPGEGAHAQEIVEGNVDSYLNPAVRLIEKPKTGPASIAAGSRTIAAYQLEAVVDRDGAPIRTRMVGYAKGDDFIRVMTGYRDDGVCRHQTVERSLAALKWP